MKSTPHYEAILDVMDEMFSDHYAREKSTIIYLGDELFREIEAELDFRSMGGPRDGLPVPSKAPESGWSSEAPPPQAETYGRTQMAIHGRTIIRDPTIEERRALIIDTAAIKSLRATEEVEKPMYVLESAAAIRELTLASDALLDEDEGRDGFCAHCQEPVGGEVWLEGTGGEKYCDINCMNEELKP